MFEPGTKTIEYKHTLSAQRRLMTKDKERFITALEAESQITDPFLTQLFANS